MYAIINIKGFDFKVEKGMRLLVPYLGKKAGDSVIFDTVSVLKKDKKIDIGSPYIDNVSVEAKIIDEKKSKKVVVFKYKKRKNYRRKKGHRELYSEIEIVDIKE